MKIDRYSKENFMTMDPMHDSYAKEIKLENNYLIIIYDKLDEGVLAIGGKPYYKNKKLTIKYEFETECEAIVYYNENKYLYIDMRENISEFYKFTKNCIFESYKYSFDSFGELTLYFSIKKIINGKYLNYKYSELEIRLDAVNVTYIWE